MGMVTMRRIVLGSTAILVVLFLAIVAYPRIAGPGTDDTRDDAAQDSLDIDISPDRALPVVGATVLRGTLAISVSAAGQATADQRTTIVAQVEGPISQVFVREAAPVRAGQIILAIDSTEYALGVASAQARLTQAEARFRELTLFDDQIEDPDIRAERARVSRGKSGLDEAQVGLRLARLEFQRSIVRAPFAGRIADLRVVPGQWVTRQSELATVVDLNPIRLEVQVVETAVGLLSAGRLAQVSFAAFPDHLR
jgi:HlyD family secretion protein